MNKGAIAILLCLVVGLLFSSCGNNKDSNNNNTTTSETTNVITFNDGGSATATPSNNNVSVANTTISNGTIDTWEPDNAWADAKLLNTDGTWMYHDLSPAGDIDRIKFSGVAGTTYTITTKNVTCSGGQYACDASGTYSSALTVFLRDALNVTITTRLIANATVSDAFTFTPTTTGTYYLAIGITVYNATQWDTAGTGNCSISILGNGTTPANLKSISVSPANSVIAELNNTMQYTATATYADNTTGDITGSAVWTTSSSNVASINFSGVAKSEFVGTTDVIASSGNIAGTTKVTVSATDTWEPDNTWADAKLLNTDGTWMYHDLSPAGDIDCIKFSGVAGTTYTITTKNVTCSGGQYACDASGTYSSALTVFLRDALNVTITTRLIANATVSDAFTFTPTTTGTYYLAIGITVYNATQWDTAGTGKYRISIK